MTEDQVQDTAQENPETPVENKQESPSDPSLLQEIMAKKEKIRTLESELAKKNDDPQEAEEEEETNQKRFVKKYD